MIGRRLAALLCVLLAHAWFIFLLTRPPGAEQRRAVDEDFETAPITLYLPSLPEEEEPPAPAAQPSAPARQRTPPSAASEPAPLPGESKAISETSRADTSHVDWPIEGKKAAARVLAREAEAERVARMFAGPGGTWASLTKRQRSKLNKFRFKPGIDGLEYDAQGNQIFHISDGCVIVNSMFFACALGKPKVHDDMFDNMQLYFDEQRLPETKEGNGTEPEALRPPY
jgi:hypothetical protein